MPKQKTITKTVITEDDNARNPISRSLREFLLESSPFPESLLGYQFKISVQKFNNEQQRFVSVLGRTYDNVQTLLNDVGARSGSGKYRFMINVLDESGKQVSFTRIEDCIIDYAGEPAKPAERVPEASGLAMQYQLEIKKLEMQQAHELRMKQLDLQAENIRALAAMKSGGGGKQGTDLNQIKELIEFVDSLRDGYDDNVAPQPVLPQSEKTGFDRVLEVINSPLGKILFEQLTNTQRVVSDPKTQTQQHSRPASRAEALHNAQFENEAHDNDEELEMEP